MGDDPMRPIRRKVCLDIKRALGDGILELGMNKECYNSPILKMLDGMLQTILTLEGFFTLNEKYDNTQKGYGILMEYWDSIPDDDKAEIDAKLKELGL